MKNRSDVSYLFSNKSPTVFEIYKVILKKLENIGPVIVEPKKTSIHLKSKSAFGGVHPRKNWLDFNLVMDRKINDDRIIKVEKVSANRFHNYFRFEKASDIDGSFMSLLANSYQLMN